MVLYILPIVSWYPGSFLKVFFSELSFPVCGWIKRGLSKSGFFAHLYHSNIIYNHQCLNLPVIHLFYLLTHLHLMILFWYYSILLHILIYHIHHFFFKISPKFIYISNILFFQWIIIIISRPLNHLM